MKKRLGLLFFLLICIGAGYGLVQGLALYLAEGFCMSHITSNHAYNPRWDTKPLSDYEERQVKRILQQEFRYLGNGSQCYVFESDDGKYVLKFFKHHRSRVPNWTAYLRFPTFLDTIHKERVAIKKSRRKRLFKSCKIAFEELRRESGLLYLHLNKSCHLNTNVTVRDKIGRPYALPLDDYEFLLQKHAHLVYPTIQNYMSKGDINGAKTSLKQLLDLLVARYRKGITDGDAVLKKNAGFLDTQAVYIDLGQFGKNEKIKDPTVYRNETKRITRKFRLWLEKSYPDLATYFDQQIEML